MSAQGTVDIDFGAFPGTDQVTSTVTGQAAFDASLSLAEAWLMPSADTTNHTVDEQMNDPLDVFCSDFSTGNGFTIYARARAGTGPRFGKYKIAWCWA